jgi:hypothetical protein
MDISEVVVTAPGDPVFTAAGLTVDVYSLAIGAPNPPLEISEVVPDNRTGLRDEANGTPDWIEIRNCSAAPVSLAGVSIGQRFFGNSERLFFTNLTLAPGEHYVVYADSNPDQGPLHAPFGVDRDGDTLVLTGITPNGSRFLIDNITFGPRPRTPHGPASAAADPGIIPRPRRARAMLLTAGWDWRTRTPSLSVLPRTAASLIPLSTPTLFRLRHGDRCPLSPETASNKPSPSR